MPNEDSDGHLRRLRCLVSTFDTGSNVTAEPASPADGRDFDVIAILDGVPRDSGFPWLEGSSGAKFYAGQTPLQQGSESQPAVAAFKEAVQRRYGVAPSTDATQGCDAARRIDAAVRREGGVSNPAALQGRLDAMRDEFAW